jgi:hypothetical protein
MGIPNVSQVRAFGSPCLKLSTFGWTFILVQLLGLVSSTKIVFIQCTLQTLHAMSKSKTKINLPFVYMKLLGFFSRVIFTNV